VAFSLSLAGYLRQSFRDFELIIADDGSDRETFQILENFKKVCDFPILHIWQENRGYRRAMIVNRAVALSRGDLLILSDGDCIPHRDFVYSHIKTHKGKALAVGSYVRLPFEFSKNLTPEMIKEGIFEKYLSTLEKMRFLWMHIKNLFYIAIRKRDKPKVFSCNISVDRELFFRINGYDENFAGFGKEDSDLRNRLVRCASAKSVFHRAFVFHIDHRIDEKKIKQPLRNKVKEKEYYYRNNIPIRCENGIDKWMR
jgi:hypothetical protein